MVMKENGMVSWEDFKTLREGQLADQRIVFTNGCFDLLHPGHVDLLDRAKQQGDLLVVGLNSDDSVRRIKGPDRPVNRADDRARVLLGLRSVDFVLIFDQDTPLELIRLVQPDVLIKGGDWPVNKIIGRDIVESRGGIVLSLTLLPGYSTTNLIERICRSCLSRRSAHE